MPLPSSNLVPLGRGWHARGRGHCRRKPGRVPQHAQAHYCMYYWVGKHQIRRGRRAFQSPTSQGSAESLCARVKGQARTGRFLTEKLISVHGLFCFLRRPTRRDERATFLGHFPGMHRALDGSRSPPPWILVLKCYFLCMNCGLENFGLLSKLFGA